ncbi:MAG: bifunctional folylpolyglutamate synthase/dihydrofolate synthase [Dehalococcoidia bacterium]|nr:MAG: bifunctional folylpolyglutamate synthase/dihydrofolate synthase [Dehalococcoidia bacterium]
MDFPAAVDYILSFADYERMPRSAVVFDLRRMEQLLARLGNPQNMAKSVHIAGTKGKGSTAAMIASILVQSGYRTGLYTSPHLLNIRERIQVDGRQISEAGFARLTEMIKPEVATVNASGGLGELTTYEILTALAFAYFRDKKVDYQVLEVGLGGRLDATNVVKPEVCVITSISYDHMEVLGETLAEIAQEKAGIIKPGSITVTAPQSPGAMEVLEKVCQQQEVKLVRVGRDVTWQRESFRPEGQSFKVRGMRGEYQLRLPLIGEHQLENAATAVAATEALAERGARITAETVSRGIANVNWPGRLQILRQKPWIIVDGAHNGDSMQRLVAAIRQYFTFDKATVIFGASSDKNITDMVSELGSFPDCIIVTQSKHPRAVAVERLTEEFSRQDVIFEVAADVESAMERALSLAGPADLVCATGSLFLVAEVMEYMLKPA